jgi:hypothetical protein
MLPAEQRKFKAAVLRMLGKGETTVGELSYFLDIHRQTMQQWVNKAGLDVPELRFQYLERKWKAAR